MDPEYLIHLCGRRHRDSHERQYNVLCEILRSSRLQTPQCPVFYVRGLVVMRLNHDRMVLNDFRPVNERRPENEPRQVIGPVASEQDDYPRFDSQRSYNMVCFSRGTIEFAMRHSDDFGVFGLAFSTTVRSQVQVLARPVHYLDPGTNSLDSSDLSWPYIQDIRNEAQQEYRIVREDPGGVRFSAGDLAHIIVPSEEWRSRLKSDFAASSWLRVPLYLLNPANDVSPSSH